MNSSQLIGTVIAVALVSSVVCLGRSQETSHQELKVVQSGPYKFKIAIIQESNSFPSQDYLAWGQFDTPMIFRIKSIAASRGGDEEIIVPKSAYADLYEPNTFKLTLTGDGCTLRIKGGDAGSSYDAQLVVRDNAVVQRQVRDGEFPKDHFERTNYHFVDYDN